MRELKVFWAYKITSPKRGNPLNSTPVFTINNRILYLSFNILHTKISSYKFLNSLKYPYLLAK